MSDTKLTAAEEYFDGSGNLCSLDTLCRREPGWAANRIRVWRAELDAALAEVERAWVLHTEEESRRFEAETEVERLAAEVERWKLAKDPLFRCRKCEEYENERDEQELLAGQFEADSQRHRTERNAALVEVAVLKGIVSALRDGVKPLALGGEVDDE